MKNKNLLASIILFASPLGLLASSDTDHKIEQTANDSYNYRTVLNGDVKARADDGVVTLTGTVQDNDAKALAEDTVDNIPGVVSVKNEIDVKSGYPEHSDAWIAFKVRSLLLVKGNVSATSTTVDVHDGVVTLGGTADTQAQKELTEVYAKEVDHVKSVNNNIVVNEKPASDTIGVKIDDASITSQVKFALLDHKATSALKTKVTTTDGVVYISGEASSSDEEALVTKLAQDVRGTKSVVNNMTIKN
jgi:hyperosmotically inducible protein